MKFYLIFLTCLVVLLSCNEAKKQTVDNTNISEAHRPQIHFTPQEKWMNDPNGMVYHNGTYHLFYQYYPDSTVWGPMHWGHATSTDLMHWDNQPIALYPDTMGYIFSGSAVVDANNTSGFGKNGKVPLVAIFTHDNPEYAKAGRIDVEKQSIAYSLDDGKTWTKYEGNPVVKNPGIRDFRDPKVSWHEPSKKWIMTLAAQDRIMFFSSPDLKDWSKESEFGKEIGAHGGVWECPDLFSLEHEGKEVWVLLVSINPGGPNGGSATQYFTGQFDGKTFTPYQTDIRWIDYGPDDYAGVTWSNTGKRKIFLGWMSNWQYASVVPTEKWRGANTIPRDLSLQKQGDKYFLCSNPAPELKALITDSTSLQNIDASNYDLSAKTGKLEGPAKLTLHIDQLADFSLTLSNEQGQKLLFGYEKRSNQYFIDRTTSGKVSFEKNFAKKHIAPRLTDKPASDITLVIDDASIEVFADDGLTVMTEIFFPDSNYSNIRIQSTGGLQIKSLDYYKLKSIYQNKAGAHN